MWTQLELFDPGPLRANPLLDLSPTRRRTMRRQALLDAGVNPASRRRIRTPPGETCASCAHLLTRQMSRRYFKCAQAPGGPTAGPATDTRLGWPACVLWEPGDDYQEDH